MKVSLLTCSSDSIRYLSLHDKTYLTYFSAHTDRVTSLALSPGSDAFLSCSLDNTVRLWNLNSKNPQGKLMLATPYLAAFDPSATVFAIASPSTSSILLYDLRNFDRKPFETFDLQAEELRHTPGTVGKHWTKLEFSNDGKSILLGTEGQGHFLLDAFDGKLKSFLARKSGPSGRSPPGVREGVVGQGDVCFSPDGRFVIGGSGREGGASVWDTTQPAQPFGNGLLQLRPTADLPWKGPTAMAEYNPRYNMLATADKEMVFWLPDELAKEVDK